MVDFSRRYTQEEAAPLVEQGYELVDVTQLVDAERMFMVVRTPAPVRSEAMFEVRAVCEWR